MKHRSKQIDQLEVLTRTHELLKQYGRHRLEPAGWRELGVGSLTAAGEGFRRLAVDVATEWATYEFEDSHGQTVAGFAQSQPDLLDSAMLGAAVLLERSRLAPYRVLGHDGPQVVLRGEGVGPVVAGVIRAACLPVGALVAARVVRNGRRFAVLSSFVLDEAEFVGVRPDPQKSTSRQTLDAVLRQVCEVDDLDRSSVLESRLLHVARQDVVRLDRALAALEHRLRPSRSALTRRMTPWGEFVAERYGAGWRVSLRGLTAASAERVPAEVAHPFDVELMRQVGANGYAIEVRGPVAMLAEACAAVAVSRERRVA